MGEGSPWLRLVLILLGIAAGFYLGGILWELGERFADVILIFFLAWLLAFLLTPTVNLLTRWRHLPRVAAVSIVYLVLLLLLVGAGFLVLPTTAEQLAQLGRSLPDYLKPVPGLVTSLQSSLDELGLAVRLSDFYQPESLVRGAEALGTALAQNALGIAQGVAMLVVNIVLILVLSFYMTLDHERLSHGLLHLLPARFENEAAFFLESVSRTFGGFMRGILIQATIYGLGTALVMLVGGLPFVLAAAVFGGLVMIVPFVGSFLAILPPVLIALVGGDPLRLLLVLVSLLVLQQVVLNVIGPKVMGESVGMHPLLVLASILVGIKIAGVWGALFGVPVAGVLFSMANFFYQRARLQREPLPTTSTRRSP